jgi:alpha-glucosidase
MKLYTITNWSRQENELVFHCGKDAVIGMSFAEKDILRLRFNIGEDLREDPDKMVVEQTSAMDCFLVHEEANGLRITTEAFCLLVGFRPVTLEARTPDGRVIVHSKKSAFGDVDEAQAVLRLSLAREEKIFGLGQDPMGVINQRDHERRMWNEWGGLHVCANAALPFYLSSGGYGLLLNNGWPARFAVGSAEVSNPPPAHSIERSKGPWEWGINSGEEDPDDLSLILENDRMDVYLVMRSCDEAIRGYTELTGAVPLPPKWAFGYMQSKNRYRSSEEFLQLARDYRKKGIPCDTLVLDWLWFNQFGDMEWDESNWKEPEKMLKEIHDMGFHVMQAYHPFIYEDSLKVEEFRKKGFLMDTPAGKLPIFDHSNPEAREEWWQQTLKFVKQGIDAYWIDMGEPRDHWKGTTCHIGSREHVHNLYSLFWAKGLYEGHRRDLKTRVFSLPRTSYAGIQRYGAALWSNDIESSWEVLKDQVPAGLGVCMSGLPYWCTDIGGFSTDDRFSPELMVRWMEWGVFCPLFRTHGTRPENEAWSHGEEANRIFEDYIRLRYRLMPYIYTCARDVTETGKPMMRALFLDFPKDEIACGQKYEYMFGPSILAAPVLDKDARQREVYLPEGVWYDYWTDKKLIGGRTITAAAPLNRIPLYIREGAVIPMADCVNYIDEKPMDNLYVHVYGDRSAEYILYEDDGVSYDYEGGAYAKTKLFIDGDNLTSVLLEGNDKLIPAGRKYKLVRHTGGIGAASAALNFDSDLNTDGVCRIHLTADTLDVEAAYDYTVEVPSGWRLTDAPVYFRKTPLNKGAVVKRGVADMMFEFTPIREILPLKHTAIFSVNIAAEGKIEHVVKEMTWGTGYLNQAAIIGFFDQENTVDADIMKQIEAGIIKPGYDRKASAGLSEKNSDDGELSSGGAAADASDGRISWNHFVSYNCWGYVDMRPMSMQPMKNGKGAGYARFRIWSPREADCLFEFAAERSFTLWINGNRTFEKSGIQPKQIPKEGFRLNKGFNECLVKCTVDYPKQMSGREIGFSLKILDEDGKMFDTLLYTL